MKLEDQVASLELCKRLKHCTKCLESKLVTEFYRRQAYCKKCSLKRTGDYYRANKERYQQRERERKAKFRTEILTRRTEDRRRLRREALAAYGGKCVCCGETQFEFLAFDHVGGGGNKHRKIVKPHQLIGWLKRNNYPPSFRILCHNCNVASGIYGRCPHEIRRTSNIA